MTRTGIPTERSLVIASVGVKPRPPATTRSAPAPEHAGRVRTRTAKRAGSRPGGAARVVWENVGSMEDLRSGMDSGGVATNRGPLASTRIEGGVLIGRSHGFCLPFSRRFEHAPCGRRPDSRPRGSAHRSGTVLGSHQLRDHTTWSGKVPRRAPGQPLRALSAALVAHATYGAL